MQSLWIPEKITLTKNGTWLSNGEPIEHERTILTFFRSVRRNPSGSGYVLAIGDEQKEIDVEEFAFFVTELEATGESLALRISDGARETFSVSEFRLVDDQTVVVEITRNGLLERARLLRGPHLQFLRDHYESL